MIMPKSLCVGLVVAATACAGCASTPSHRDLSAFLSANEHVVSATETRFSPGDSISIIAPRIFEIDGEGQQIQPDGKISLELLGEVKVAGLSPREVATKLEELLTPYYNDPHVRVRVTNQPDKVFYVLGQVGGPGPMPYTGHDTLLHVLARNQPNRIAWKSRVKVIRPSPIEGERFEIRVDVDTMMKTGDTRANILLQPGDVVYVPPTPFGWIALRIQDLFVPTEPILDAYATPYDFIATQNVYSNPTASSGRTRSRRRGGR